MKHIKGTAKKYSVNKKGQVFSHVTRSGNIDTTLNQLRKHQLSIWGYCVIDLSINKNRIKKPVHRLVAEAYIPNPKNKPCVNHIDGNKQNNNLSNLEWVTYSENELHSIHCLGKENNCKKAIAVYRDGEFLGTFLSMKEAGKFTGAQPENIRKVILGKRNHAGGCTYEYI